MFCFLGGRTMIHANILVWVYLTCGSSKQQAAFGGASFSTSEAINGCPLQAEIFSQKIADVEGQGGGVQTAPPKNPDPYAYGCACSVWEPPAGKNKGATTPICRFILKVSFEHLKKKQEPLLLSLHISPTRARNHPYYRLKTTPKKGYPPTKNTEPPNFTGLPFSLSTDPPTQKPSPPGVARRILRPGAAEGLAGRGELLQRPDVQRQPPPPTTQATPATQATPTIQATKQPSKTKQNRPYPTQTNQTQPKPKPTKTTIQNPLKPHHLSRVQNLRVRSKSRVISTCG